MGSLPNSIFKFVVNSEEDWNEIQKDYITPGFITKEKIVVMPEGQTQDELSKTRELAADIAIREGVRFTDRLHVTIWNKKTGV
jgi:7-carboxy-7-deazaguanine synthase